MIKIQEEDLIEITDRELKERFLKILNLLIRFDVELSSSLDPDHLGIMAVSRSIPESLQLWIKNKGENIFYVSAHCETEGISITAQWNQEDRFILERKEYKDDLSHPIHEMDCMTDIYREAIGEIKKTKEKEGVDG